MAVNEWNMLSGHTLEQFLAVEHSLGVPDHNDPFEQALITTHYQYLIDRRAFVVKLAVAKGYDKQSGRFFPKAKTTYDFIGWTATGKPIAFDAKRHAKPRWRFSDAKAHQWHSLRMVKAMDGLAFFLVNREGRAYIIDPDVIQPGEGIDLAHCASLGYPWDWLERIEDMLPDKLPFSEPSSKTCQL